MGDESSKQRGSEWHRWEPHIHTPGTVKEDRYSGADAWDRFLDALESATPVMRAIGITDYGVTTSYEKAKAAREGGRLNGCELLFPNIELRLDHGTIKGNFINVHLLVSPEDKKHVEEVNRFLGRLRFIAYDDTFSCTPADLMRLGRRVDGEVITDAAALELGYTQFKVSLRQLLDVYRDMQWAQDNIIIAVAGGADGASGLKDAADTTLREEVEKASHAIFSGNPKDRDFWMGSGVASADVIRERYGSLKPCIWGCDAHEIAKVGKPDLDRLCWVKGKPSFDALRQACIDPERAYVGLTPPRGGNPSQTIDTVELGDASWCATPILQLNPGLVAVIGARGSGKTALADVIATACDAYTGSQARPSFLARAKEFMSGATVTVRWEDADEDITRPLDAPVNVSPDAYARARYLSQQFVEELCSVEGMPKLIEEIERVIFEAHPVLDRDGALTFGELLEMRAGGYRMSRQREEEALANISDQIGAEMEKKREIDPLKLKIAAKEKALAGYRRDRDALLPKGPSQTAGRLQQLTDAAEKVQGYIRYYSNQKTSLTGIQGEVADFRQNFAPRNLREMQDRNKQSGLKPPDWEPFLPTYSGDVDAVVQTKAQEAERRAAEWKGKVPTAPLDESGAFVAEDSELERLPLATLQAEIARLGGVLLEDQEKAKRLAAVSKKISEEAAELEKLTERLVDCEGAQDRATQLVADRQLGYERVFEAILSEERVLNELYAPLMTKLRAAGGTLAKLSFKVERVADVKAWAAAAEADLFDLRGGPFRGIGSLEKVARAELLPAWERGDAKSASEAMTAFQGAHTSALIEKANIKRDDPAVYRPWSRRFAQWLYGTEHISIQYGIRYDGVEIEKLSPGTRGIVLVLLYLALDDADARPLIIDQPEENLDPRSIYQELVPLFIAAKRKRQIIMVTHNANLVINTDADQVVIASVSTPLTGGLPTISYQTGGLEEEPIRKNVCDILEGGESAFRDRARRLRIGLARGNRAQGSA